MQHKRFVESKEGGVYDIEMDIYYPNKKEFLELLNKKQSLPVVK